MLVSAFVMVLLLSSFWVLVGFRAVLRLPVTDVCYFGGVFCCLVVSSILGFAVLGGFGF